VSGGIALLTAPVTAGFALAGADEDTLAAGRVYGENLGLAFQIVDDLLDLEGDAALMGKTLGKDVAEGKLTWPACVGAEKARQDAAACIDLAVAALNPLGEKALFLQTLAENTLHRVQ
ncbi:MAG: polyprenyl synthetase family protein, partial [Clostridia bacterium]|nr:polyprenyl synthetase family protein [Clostridia bacterium]